MTTPAKSPQQAYAEAIVTALRADSALAALIPSAQIRTWWDIVADYAGMPEDTPLPAAVILVHVTDDGQAPQGAAFTKFTANVFVNVAHDIPLATLQAAGVTRAYELWEAMSGAAARVVRAGLTLSADGYSVRGAVWLGEQGMEPEAEWLKRLYQFELHCNSIPYTTTTTTTTTSTTTTSAP